jgi:FlaA1/EpsC-like NDP-sugar epimerase
MMEDHPREAVNNNFFGTRAIADAAAACRAERFVMISTDKAVNPTSVMGATKRMAELYVQHMDSRHQTVFTMVRFGNVLGSACSVIPIWSSQLINGGPITVTDPAMTRYFMTIPEAAALVLQAGCLPDVGGQVLLLDMGQPLRIVELAERFIRLQGLEPQTDVPIVFTGARPGEKLFEELAYDSEDMIPTTHAAVRIWRTQPPQTDRIEKMIRQFGQLRDTGQPMQILEALRQAVPEMKPLSTGATPSDGSGVQPLSKSA